MTDSPRAAAIRQLRQLGAADTTIAEACQLTRQRIHALAGPRPAPPASPAGPAGPAPSAQAPAALPQAMLTWRTRRGLSQVRAAAAIGIDPMTWSRWETGTQTCRIAHLVLNYLEKLDKNS